jgi:hypothetical protein
MITTQSTNLLDTIFSLGDVEMKIALMHVFQGFLDTEETRIQKRAEGKEGVGLKAPRGIRAYFLYPSSLWR